MFGFGNRQRSSPRRHTGIFGSGGLRGAAIAGLGMMAYRWWRNRNVVRPGEDGSPAGNW